MALALKLGIEEWEEFEHMEMSMIVMEGTKNQDADRGHTVCKGQHWIWLVSGAYRMK